MSKLNDNGFLSGHTGNMVFREVNGKQVMQAMPSHYHDRNSEAQQKQRSGMRNILANYRALKDVVQDQFEDAVGPHRPYDCFKHHNLLLPAVDLAKKEYDVGLAIPATYIVSHGSLPTLKQTVVDGRLRFEMKLEDWKRGDILRFVRVRCKEPYCGTPIYLHGSYSETIINGRIEQLIVSEPLTSGAYTYVHLRPTSRMTLASSQHLIVIE